MTVLFPSSLRLSVSSSLFPLLLCHLVTYHSASAQEIIHGSFTWPDRGLRIQDDPNIPDQSAIVQALAAHADGRLYVGGYFNYAGELPTRAMAAWDGEHWIDIGSTGDGQPVNALASDVSGLYAGGFFSQIAGIPLPHIGRWDGVTWHPLGTGVNDDVSAIYVRQEETGGPPVVYAGGRFTEAGGQPANRVARWDGTAWSNLGLGCSERVASIAVFDDGSGPALYVTGSFQKAGGIVVRRVAKWDFQTQTWSALGQGITSGGSGRSLAVFPPQPHPDAALYLCGSFTEVDGQPIRDIARWDGQAWAAADNGLYRIDDYADVMQLRVLDDGHGPALYCTELTGNGGYLQKWNGESWARYEPTPGSIWSVEFYDGQLHVGGSHTAFHTKIARFTPGFACGDFNGDGVVDQQDLGILLSAYDCSGPGCKGDADGDGDVDQSDLGILLKHFGQPCS